MTSECPDPTQLRLREERMIGKPMVLQQRLHGAGAAPETKRIDRENRDVRIGVVALVARGLVLPRQCLPHDHPQRVARRDAVTTSKHELVAIRMLGTTV